MNQQEPSKAPKSLADRLFDHDQLDHEVYETVCKILGFDWETDYKGNSSNVPCADTYYDPYDGSIEVVRKAGQTGMTKEQANAILDLGFCCIFESIGDMGIYHSRNGEPCPCRAVGGAEGKQRKYEQLLSLKDKEIERLKAERLNSEIAHAEKSHKIVRLEERLAAYSALLEQVPHIDINARAWYHQTADLPCVSSCPRCAYEKLKGAQ